MIGASFDGFTVNSNDVSFTNSLSLTVTETCIIPVQFSSGIIVKVFSIISIKALPSISAEYSSSSPSTSFPIRVYSNDESSDINWSSMGSITGASFMGLTVRDKRVDSLKLFIGWPSST